MSETPSPSPAAKTPTSRTNSGASTNRILSSSENIETPPLSTIPTSPRSTLPSSTSPFLQFRTKIELFKESDEKNKNEASPRQPILTKEIMEKAAKIEEQLKAHKDGKAKFQLSYLLSPKKFQSYKKEKKAWKSQDPVNLALEERHRRNLTTPPKKPTKAPEVKITEEIYCDQKLNRKVIEELAGKFKYTFIDKTDV